MADRRNAFADWQASNNHDALDHLIGIPVAKPKPKRDRQWSKKHPAYVRKVPNYLRDRALGVRENVNSIAYYEEDGTSRKDSTTVDDIAREMFLYFFDYVLPNNPPEFLPAKDRKGKMKAKFVKTEPTWQKRMLKPAPKKKSKSPKQVVLAYRLPDDVIEKIEELAGPNFPAEFREDGTKINHPHRFTVPPGEIIVLILEIAIDHYLRGEFKFKTGPDMVSRSVSGWSKP